MSFLDYMLVSLGLIGATVSIASFANVFRPTVRGTALLMDCLMVALGGTSALLCFNLINWRLG